MDFTPKVNLRTPISIKKPVGLDENDQPIYEIISNNGVPIVFKCEWKGVYGNEVFNAYAENSTELATITMRYYPDITPDCIVIFYETTLGERIGSDILINSDILLGSLLKQYEIIGTPDNIGKKNKWLQFKVRRFENG